MVTQIFEKNDKKLITLSNKASSNLYNIKKVIQIVRY